MVYIQFTEAEIRDVRAALILLEQNTMLELKKEGTGALHKKYNRINALRKHVDSYIENQKESRDD